MIIKARSSGLFLFLYVNQQFTPMIKILALSPIKEDGTSFYRGFGPLNHLAKTHDVQITNGAAGTEVSWDLITQFDLVFLQRPSTLTEVQVMELAKRCNRPILIDYDDDYLNIPTTNPRHDLYADKHRVQQIRRIIDLADFIIVSTLSIKENIHKATGKDRNRIQVVPNAVDETLFEIAPLKSINHRDVVLWRGGDTHGADVDMYLDKMVELYNDFPRLKWAFMGHAPKNLLSRIDGKRIMLYPFDEIMKYFEWLFELRPMLTLVPWEDNTFNRGKSNCVWLESTMAGAPVVFPKWSTEFVEGMVGYNDPDSFYKAAYALLSDLENREFYYNLSQETLSNRFTLGRVNSVRMNVIEQLLKDSVADGKLGVNHPKYTVEPVQYTDKQFFDYTWEKMWNQDFDQYLKGHHETAKWLYEKFTPKSVVDLGCGPGPLVEAFCDLRVPQVKGIELNPHFKKYFDDRNPHYKDSFIEGSFLDLELTGVFDLGISIEVFEHIPDDLLVPFIAKMADHFKVFYFSSTPYRSSFKFDQEWGHCNLKPHEAWVKLFEANGFQYVENPNKIILWDALFVSTRIKEDKTIALKEEHLTQ